MKTETMTPEQYANKFGIPNGSQEQSLYRFAEEYSEYVNTAASNKTAAGIRWVNVEERLPEQDENVIWRMDDGQVFNGHMDEHAGRCWVYIENAVTGDSESFSPNDFKEWLDEDSPASGKWSDEDMRKCWDAGAAYTDTRNGVYYNAPDKEDYFKSLPSAGERKTVSE